jgi:hypothetical protein
MARQLRTQLEHEVTMEEMTRSRPAQPASPPPSPPPSTPDAAAPANSTPPPGPELDLDAKVSGIERVADLAADAAADAAVAADIPLKQSAP